MKRNPARAESLCRIFVCGTGIAVGLYLADSSDAGEDKHREKQQKKIRCI